MAGVGARPPVAAPRRPVFLRTPRLLLREFTPEDVPAVLAYQRDPRYLRFDPSEERTEEEARALVERFIEWARESPRSHYQLAIALASSGELIGNFGVRRSAPGSRVAEVGFELAPGHWGHGYATEAGMAMLEMGFRTLGLHRVHAHCIAENAASARVLERLGMRPEGRLRDGAYLKGRWWDILLYGVLAPEWAPAER